MTVTITYTIPGVPLLDQLHSLTSDGGPDENARYNCVFTCNAALATAYLHRPFNGDQIKDMDNNYGQGYIGGASEFYLVDTMRSLGITMTALTSATQQGLVDILHREIAAGHPCIVTMPSQWNSAVENAGSAWNPRTYGGPRHAGLACGYGQDGSGQRAIRVMNPWGGFWHDGDDGYWAARLLEGEVWVATMTIPQGWKDDGKTLVAPNGVPVVRGFREWVMAHSWDANNTPLKAEQAIQSGSIEPGNATMGPGSRQDFRFTSLGWTTRTGVYEIAVGQDIVALEAQLAAALTHVTQLEQQLQNQPAPVPTPVETPPDPKAVEALAAVMELAKALKLVAGSSQAAA
jgi:hypothetical protein